MRATRKESRDIQKNALRLGSRHRELISRASSIPVSSFERVLAAVRTSLYLSFVDVDERVAGPTSRASDVESNEENESTNLSIVRDGVTDQDPSLNELCDFLLYVNEARC